ncbi:MAG: hypothetical protein CR997_07235 [Acidobacteria bacterium]|nr:MAG: hypothetical protein CR997_07235 [Acidobacteriota bacterium]
MVKRAFTLMEITVIVTVLVLLASIAAATHKSRVRNAKESVLKHNLAQIRLTLDAYNADRGHYPESLQTLVDEGYMRRLPEDPFTGSSDTWEVIYEEGLADEDTSYIPGVFDVRSGSVDEAMDGTFYNEW